MRKCPRCSGWLNKHQNTRCPECLLDLTNTKVIAEIVSKKTVENEDERRLEVPEVREDQCPMEAVV